MKMADSIFAQVILPIPVRRHFDYLVPAGFDPTHPLTGRRVVVPFGKTGKKIGLVIGQSAKTDIDPSKLKSIVQVIDDTPILNKNQLLLRQWVSHYYLAPIGELFFSSLPPLMRQGNRLLLKQETCWQVTETGRHIEKSTLKKAKKQLRILEFMMQLDGPCSKSVLNDHFRNWRAPLSELEEKGLVETINRDIMDSPPEHAAIDVTLNPEQQKVFKVIDNGLKTNERYLLDGITGSGKTEIYIKAIQAVLQEGKQALVLVPEIGLTPHFISRFKQRLDANIVVLHSGLTDNERLQSWIKARNGIAKVIIGTRSAVWTPMKKPGLFVVDEEHDPSYKQQEGIHYSARDVAILRASDENAAIILGSATPSLESLHNVIRNKLTRICLTSRAENAEPPSFRIIDLRGKKTHGALSNELLQSIQTVLAENKQVLLFQNRRGYSPVQMCHDCGWIHNCKRCEMPMTFHKGISRLLCHHCGAQCRQETICQDCQSNEIIPVGHGTERLYETLSEHFPDANILRIDRDTTRRKGAMDDYNEKILSGEVDILVGTQMLAKGHHFPDVTLVGIIDADMGLYSNDFRAGEKMAQLITQVSGRAGRANHPGTVILQTHYPDHPLIKTLIENDYNHFAELQLAERKSIGLPPHQFQVLLRAEGYDTEQPLKFLRQAEKALRDGNGKLELFGPYPSPIEKRRGRYRFQLLIQSGQRSELQNHMQAWVKKLDQIKTGTKVRWSLDVDPLDLL
jgi:primosomal protein N' (replication factor Y)